MTRYASKVPCCLNSFCFEKRACVACNVVKKLFLLVPLRHFLSFFARSEAVVFQGGSRFFFPAVQLSSVEGVFLVSRIFVVFLDLVVDNLLQYFFLSC